MHSEAEQTEMLEFGAEKGVLQARKEGVAPALPPKKKLLLEPPKGFGQSIFKTGEGAGPITSWQIDGETVETVADFIFGAPKSLQMVTAVMKLKDLSDLK